MCMGTLTERMPMRGILLVYRRSADTRPALAGYLRVLLPASAGGTNETGEPDIRIGRVLTTASFRGIGLGQAMLERTLGYIREQWPGQPIRLHAQARLQRFYAGIRLRASLRCSRGRRHSAHLDAPRVKGNGVVKPSPILRSRPLLRRAVAASTASASGAARSTHRSRSSSNRESTAANRRSADRASG